MSGLHRGIIHAFLMELDIALVIILVRELI